jgi:hypothetical protein
MPRASESLALPPLRRRPGWPKMATCLKCGKPRLSTGPHDRLHKGCRPDEPGEGERARVWR